MPVIIIMTISEAVIYTKHVLYISSSLRKIVTLQWYSNHLLDCMRKAMCDLRIVACLEEILNPWDLIDKHVAKDRE